MQLLLLAVMVAMVEAQARPQYPPTSSCPPCDYESCRIPVGCQAGILIDDCGCCNVCAKKEFEKCDHPDVPTAEKLGRCGDNLECRARQDVVGESICYCTLPGVMCGSDGVTYDNLCQLVAASVRTGVKLSVQQKGVCKKDTDLESCMVELLSFSTIASTTDTGMQAPTMVSEPEHAKDRAGSNVALVCEAEGYPIPSVEWTWTAVGGHPVFLPSDDLKVSVNMRGGPERSQVTGWLQIMDVEKKHEGDYTCIAQNELGVVQATARVNVIQDEVAYAKKKRRQDKSSNDL